MEKITNGALLLYHQDEYNRLRQQKRDRQKLGLPTDKLEGEISVHSRMISKLRHTLRSSADFKHLKSKP